MEIISIEDINYLANQPKASLEKIVGSMTALMSTNDAIVSELENQKWYERMIYTVTGKNKASKEEIRRNHDKLNAYMCEAVTALMQQNLLNTQLIVNLSACLNQVYDSQIQTRELVTDAFGTIQQRLERQDYTMKEMKRELVRQNQFQQFLFDELQQVNERIVSIDNYVVLQQEINDGFYNEMDSLSAICNIVSQFDVGIISESRKLGSIRRSLIKQGILNNEERDLEELLCSLRGIKRSAFEAIKLCFLSLQDSESAREIMNYLMTGEDNRGLIEFGHGDEYENNRVTTFAKYSTIDIYDELVSYKIRAFSMLPTIKKTYKYEPSIAEIYFLKGKYDIAFDEFRLLSEQGEYRANYFLAMYYYLELGSVKQNKQKFNYYIREGFENGEILCSLIYALLRNDEEQKQVICSKVLGPLIEMGKSGDPFAQNELMRLYRKKMNILTDNETEQYWRSMLEEGGIIDLNSSNRISLHTL